MWIAPSSILRAAVEAGAGPRRRFPLWLAAICLVAAFCRPDAQATMREMAPLPASWSPLPVMAVTTDALPQLGFGAAARSASPTPAAISVTHAFEPAAADPTALASLPPPWWVPPSGKLASEHVEPAQQALVRHIVANWRVDGAQVRRYVARVWRAAADLEIDPFLMLAVMATESSFDPRAQSVRGAQGLMQVHTQMHLEKFKPYGGAARAFEPEASIRVGGQILKQYLDRHGSPRAALKAYVGAARLKSDGGYGAKVLRQHAQFRSVVGTELARLPAVVAPVSGIERRSGSGSRPGAEAGSSAMAADSRRPDPVVAGL